MEYLAVDAVSHKPARRERPGYVFSVMPARANLASLCFALLVSCGGGDAPGEEGEAAAAGDESVCGASNPMETPLPGVSERLLTLAYWTEHTENLDEPLLSTDEVRAHNLALSDDPDIGLPISRASLGGQPDAARLAREVDQRLDYIRAKLTDGTYVDAAGARVNVEALRSVPLELRAEIRVALDPIQVRCAPRVEGLFKVPVDPDFDRNNCSTIRTQEPLVRLMRWPNGMWLARSRYTLGWIPGDAPLSAPITDALRDELLSGALVRAAQNTRLRSDDGAELEVARGTLLATTRGEADAIVFADARGAHRGRRSSSFVDVSRPLTRRAFLEEAFARVSRPYGWGGHQGGLDCSRFVMDVLATFGLEMPRHSARQAAAGTYAIDVSEIEQPDSRQRLIDAAAERGIVLLHFPGHIMIYLGRDGEGTPRVIHAFSEYLEPCEDASSAEGGETIRRVDEVTVSDLTLGANTSRGSFLERITDVVILGTRVGPGLSGIAVPREPAPVAMPGADDACDDSLAVRVFRSPERPNPRQPLRVFVTATEELGPMQLALFDPGGERHVPDPRRTGGPPHMVWAEIENPQAGRWTAVLGDGEHIAACERLTVSPYRPRAEPPDPTYVWRPRFRWEADTEALFSGFVEQLFDYPIEDELTWPNLSVLLADRSRNILFNHFSQNEEEDIPLQTRLRGPARTSCARTSRGRWGCRSAIACAHAADTGSFRDARSCCRPNGSTNRRRACRRFGGSSTRRSSARCTRRQGARIRRTRRPRSTRFR